MSHVPPASPDPAPEPEALPEGDFMALLWAQPRPPAPEDRVRALAVVAALGAVGGGIIGTALLAALQTRSPGGFHWSVDIPFGLVFGGTFGAAVGAAAAPLFGWLCFRHVPLGRAMAATAAGTVGGALLGLWLRGAPVAGGCLGFALAAVALRFHPPPANEALQLTRRDASG